MRNDLGSDISVLNVWTMNCQDEFLSMLQVMLGSWDSSLQV